MRLSLLSLLSFRHLSLAGALSSAFLLGATVARQDARWSPGTSPSGSTAFANAVQDSTQDTDRDTDQEAAPMPLGAFSISLAVKDLDASRDFYQKLGFKVAAGTPGQYLILREGTTNIGLFQGMFEGNILTFNPGWDHNAKPVKTFVDVRTIQSRLESQGLTLATRADETTDGPASLVLLDPDGNMILVDQHVPKPKE